MVDVALRDLGEYVQAALPDAVLDVVLERDELCLVVERDRIARVLKFLRDDVNCQFKQLMDVCGADYPGREDRFEVVYNLLSLTHNRRVRVKIAASEDTPVPTVVEVFSSANWWERETWDMFGIIFDGHPALTRILMPDDWPGHPQRKDYPLGGVDVEYKGAKVPAPDNRRDYS